MAILEEFTKYARKKMVDNYDLSGVDKENAEHVLNYFFNPSESKYDDKKGLLMAGGIGTGKTMFLKLIQKSLPEVKRFKSTTCRKVAINYNTEGSGCFDNYRGDHWFFDDLGTEMDGAFYGTKVNVMEDVILDRYDDLINKGFKTYMTTNLSLEEIKKEYGDRVFDRIKEMFEIVMFKSDQSKRGIGILKPIKTETEMKLDLEKKKQKDQEFLNSPEHREELYHGLLRQIEKGVLLQDFPYRLVFPHLRKHKISTESLDEMREISKGFKSDLREKLAIAKKELRGVLIDRYNKYLSNDSLFEVYWKGEYVKKWANQEIFLNQD